VTGKKVWLITGAGRGLSRSRQRSPKENVAAWKSMDGKQGGDPAKLADVLVKLVERAARPG
jgi:hypothetical protein